MSTISAYTAEGAAYALGVNRSTLYRYANMGWIELVKWRGRTVVLASELERFVAFAELGRYQEALSYEPQ